MVHYYSCPQHRWGGEAEEPHIQPAVQCRRDTVHEELMIPSERRLRKANDPRSDLYSKLPTLPVWGVSAICDVRPPNHFILQQSSQLGVPLRVLLGVPLGLTGPGMVPTKDAEREIR